MFAVSRQGWQQLARACVQHCSMHAVPAVSLGEQDGQSDTKHSVSTKRHADCHFHFQPTWTMHATCSTCTTGVQRDWTGGYMPCWHSLIHLQSGLMVWAMSQQRRQTAIPSTRRSAELEIRCLTPYYRTLLPLLACGSSSGCLARQDSRQYNPCNHARTSLPNCGSLHLPSGSRLIITLDHDGTLCGQTYNLSSKSILHSALNAHQRTCISPSVHSLLTITGWMNTYFVV